MVLPKLRPAQVWELAFSSSDAAAPIARLIASCESISRRSSRVTTSSDVRCRHRRRAREQDWATKLFRGRVQSRARECGTPSAVRILRRGRLGDRARRDWAERADASAGGCGDPAVLGTEGAEGVDAGGCSGRRGDGAFVRDCQGFEDDGRGSEGCSPSLSGAPSTSRGTG